MSFCLLFVCLQFPHPSIEIHHRRAIVRVFHRNHAVTGLGREAFRLRGRNPESFQVLDPASGAMPPNRTVTLFFDLTFTHQTRILRGYRTAAITWVRDHKLETDKVRVLAYKNGRILPLLSERTGDLIRIVKAIESLPISSHQTNRGGKGVTGKDTGGEAEDLLALASDNVGATAGRERSRYQGRVRQFLETLNGLAGVLGRNQEPQTLVLFSSGFRTSFLNRDQQRQNQAAIEFSGEIGFVDPEYLGSTFAQWPAATGRAFRKAGVPIFGFKLGPRDSSFDGLLTLTRDSGGTVLRAEKPEDFPKNFADFHDHAYLLGWTAIEPGRIKLKRVRGKLSVHWIGGEP